MYEMKDASNAWQKLWSDYFRSNGFELGASNPALYRSELVSGFCHGDDLMDAAAREQWIFVAREVRNQTARHGRCSRTLGQRTGSAA